MTRSGAGHGCLLGCCSATLPSSRLLHLPRHRHHSCYSSLIAPLTTQSSSPVLVSKGGLTAYERSGNSSTRPEICIYVARPRVNLMSNEGAVFLKQPWNSIKNSAAFVILHIISSWPLGDGGYQVFFHTARTPASYDSWLAWASGDVYHC